jgi:hypothetical protein
MSARDKKPAEPQPTGRDLAEQHERRLMRCRQECRPMLHQGLKQFIAEVHLYKGETEAVVYLESSAEPVRPCEISFIREAE